MKRGDIVLYRNVLVKVFSVDGDMVRIQQGKKRFWVKLKLLSEN